MIGLCDCNNFFVSCERLFNPALEGRAVVVMSGNDGCVVARSNEAKALGIKMSQPLFQIRDIVKQHNVVTISSNLQLYGDISERVMQYLRQNLPAIEVYSIDEAFLDLSGIDVEQLECFVRGLARRIRRDIGIPVSIGVSPTKTLSKIASKLCKSYPKLNGGCLMYREEDISKVLSKTAVGDIWGIGRRSTAMLNGHNIFTAEQFRSTPSEWVKAKMGVVGLRTWRELHAESCIEIDLNHSDRQSIMVSRTFQHDESDLDKLVSSVATFASMATEKLRRQKSLCSAMQVFVQTNRHRMDLPQHHEERIVRFLTPTDSTLEIVKTASDMVRELYRTGYGYKKAGAVLLNLYPSDSVQTSLFDETNRPKHKALMETMDRLNSQMGRSTVKLCTAANGGAQSLSEHRSPNYTTSWSDILTIKV